MPADKQQVLMRAVIKQLAKENLFRRLDWNAIADETGAPHGSAAFRRWNRFLQSLQGPHPKFLRVGVPKPQVPAPQPANKRKTKGDNDEEDGGQMDDEQQDDPQNRSVSRVGRESEDDVNIKEQSGGKSVSTEAHSKDEANDDSDSEIDNVSAEFDNLEVDLEQYCDWV